MLSEKYKKDQSKVTWHSIRLPIIINAIEIDPMLKIAITDLCIKKFSPESLILFVETGMDLKLDYLNRVCKYNKKLYNNYGYILYFYILIF